jgi:MFS family permease
MKRLITRRVWILSLISLFTDMASEMLYPVMPLYLKEMGFSIIGIGILEGCAEAVAGLSKSYFGAWSDQLGKRAPFVQAGYSLSAISKPMMAVFSFPLWIFFARTVDRIGKGLRTGARDAMLAEEATPETKARVFGFHRSMDTLGAMLGPAIAVAFLYYHPGEYREMFLWALIPGVLAIVCTLWLKDRNKKANPNKRFPSFKIFYSYWLNSPAKYKQLTAALLMFTLVNSSDVFLLLKMKENGISDMHLIFVYIFYNAVYALLAYPAGILADKFGVKKILCIGLLLFAAAYAGMAYANSGWMFVVVFFVYACYAACTEGIAKAWISQLIPNTELATAIGTYGGFQSIVTLLASTIAGLIWYQYGAIAVFGIAAFVTLCVTVYIHFKIPVHGTS